MDCLRKFKNIGDKYARNIGMDIFHPDFQDTIALDARINRISDELGVEFDSYEEHEQFGEKSSDHATLPSLSTFISSATTRFRRLPPLSRLLRMSQADNRGSYTDTLYTHQVTQSYQRALQTDNTDTLTSS